MSLPTRRERTMARSAGLAHRDIYPNGSKCADLLGVHRSTPPRWGRGDPYSPMNKLSTFILNAENPWESLAHFQSMAKWKVIVKLNGTELIERYWALVSKEKEIECADAIEGHQPGHAWLDRARTKRQDAAIELELAAVMTRFEELGITEATVREGHE